MEILQDICEILVSGITEVAEGIGGGLQSLVQNIFLTGTVDSTTGVFTATGLSTMGIVVICFAGIGLALGLSRWVLGFVTSLGARNR